MDFNRVRGPQTLEYRFILKITQGFVTLYSPMSNPKAVPISLTVHPAVKAMWPVSELIGAAPVNSKVVVFARLLLKQIAYRGAVNVEVTRKTELRSGPAGICVCNTSLCL